MTDIMQGTCESHTGVHRFQNDPDPCIGWMDAAHEPFAIHFPEGEGIPDVLARMIGLCVVLHRTDADPLSIRLTRVGNDVVEGHTFTGDDWDGPLASTDLDRLTAVDYL